MVQPQREREISSPTCNVKHTAPLTQHCNTKLLHNPFTHNVTPIAQEQEQEQEDKKLSFRKQKETNNEEHKTVGSWKFSSLSAKEERGDKMISIFTSKQLFSQCGCFHLQGRDLWLFVQKEGESTDANFFIFRCRQHKNKKQTQKITRHRKSQSSSHDCLEKRQGSSRLKGAAEGKYSASLGCQ